MNKAQTILQLKQYFGIKELVSKSVYTKFGENSWVFLDEKMLETLLVIRRDILKVPLVINDWGFGGKNQQRGLRENISQLVTQKTRNGQLYLSSHIFGKAIDFVSAKMSANEMRSEIINKAYLLPYPIRLESGNSAPTWVHADLMTDDDSKKIQVFN